MVADNVSRLVLANVQTRWSADPARIAAPTHALWARHSELTGDSSYLAPSDPGTPPFHTTDSTLRVRA